MVGLFANMRGSYTLGFDPPGGGGAARVVVRLGRQRLAFFNFLPNRPRFGSILADTGFAATGLGAAGAQRGRNGKAPASPQNAGKIGVGDGGNGGDGESASFSRRAKPPAAHGDDGFSRDDTRASLR